MILSRRAALAILAGSLASLALIGAPGPARAEGMVFATNGIAIHGTDPVAYFTQGKPVDGSPDHAIMWGGATWLFSSAENRAAFEADPRAYAPQYGGYCAYAASQGALAPSVPEAWTIHEGKLYLNFSTGVRTIWAEDIPGHIAAADAAFPGLIGQ